MDVFPATVAPGPRPWRTIWFSPRVTIRSVLETAERPTWIPVVALAVASSVISASQADESGAFSVSRSVMPMILGALNLVYGVIIAPFVAAIVGGWLGGEADPSKLREAIAWSYVPIAASSALWIPILLMLGMRAFAAGPEPLAGFELIGAVFLIVIAASYIWSIPLQVGGLAAAQRFSIGKGILYALILSIPVILLTALK
jgi:Yip1 domain